MRSGMFYASKLSIIKKQISIYHAMEKTALSYSLYKIFFKIVIIWKRRPKNMQPKIKCRKESIIRVHWVIN